MVKPESWDLKLKWSFLNKFGLLQLWGFFGSHKYVKSLGYFPKYHKQIWREIHDNCDLKGTLITKHKKARENNKKL